MHDSTYHIAITTQSPVKLKLFKIFKLGLVNVLISAESSGVC